MKVASQTRNIQHDSVENHTQHKPEETRVKDADDIGMRLGKAASIA